MPRPERAGCRDHLRQSGDGIDGRDFGRAENGGGAGIVALHHNGDAVRNAAHADDGVGVWRWRRGSRTGHDRGLAGGDVHEEARLDVKGLSRAVDLIGRFSWELYGIVGYLLEVVQTVEADVGLGVEAAVGHDSGNNAKVERLAGPVELQEALDKRLAGLGCGVVGAPDRVESGSSPASREGGKWAKVEGGCDGALQEAGRNGRSWAFDRAARA